MRSAALHILLFALFTGVCGNLYAQSQNGQGGKDMSEQMINAQLRFITEKSHLTKKEYKSFAPIYVEYMNGLLELNTKAAEQQPQTQQPFPNFGFGMPFDFRPDQRQQQKYMDGWNKLNKTYMEKLEKALPDSTRQKIGAAQWELNQKIWDQWSEVGRRELDSMFVRNQRQAQFPGVGMGGFPMMGNGMMPDTAMMRRFGQGEMPQFDENWREEAEKRWHEIEEHRTQWQQNYWMRWNPIWQNGGVRPRRFTPPMPLAPRVQFPHQQIAPAPQNSNSK